MAPLPAKRPTKMKISNETKIGILAAFAITLLILGFNFLKGKTFFGKSHTLYAKYSNVQGLANSNPVMINGLQVGTVYSITPDKSMKQILVNMTLTKDVDIPKNSIATINTDLLGSKSIVIHLGDATQFIPKNDTIATEPTTGIFNEILSKFDPVLGQLKHAVTSVDSVLGNFNKILDPSAKNNIGAMLENLNKTTANLITASASLNVLLNTQTGALAGTLNNLNSFTGNLSKNNDKINSLVDNLDKTAGNLSKLELCAKIKQQLPSFVYQEAPVGEDPDKRDYIVSNDKIERTGFRPQVSLDDGIAELRKGYTMLRNTKYGNV